MPSEQTPRFTARHVALGRAAAAAIAALMITFSADHSAPVGLSVFSGFAVMTGLVWGLAAWLVAGTGERGMPILMALFSITAGIVSAAGGGGFGAVLLQVTMAVWAITGVVELVWGILRRRTDRAVARDAMTVGVLTIVFGIVVAVVPVGAEWTYFNREAGVESTLSGITIVVGALGAYAAIVAVYEAIIGFSPQRAVPAADETDVTDAAGESAPLSGKAER